MFVPAFHVGVYARLTQISGHLLDDGRVLIDRRMNGDSEDAILRNIFTVPAIRAVVDEPRPVNGDEPDNAEKKNDCNAGYYGAIHLNAYQLIDKT